MLSLITDAGERITVETDEDQVRLIVTDLDGDTASVVLRTREAVYVEQFIADARVGRA